MAYWCLNFDPHTDPDQHRMLNYGLDQSLWLMQYQYPDKDHVYQGGTMLSATTRNWRTLGKIKPGDQCLAYLPNSMFYAVGDVIKRRQRARHQEQPFMPDDIGRTTTEHSHKHVEGIVEYTPVFYEDFTDNFQIEYDLNPGIEVYRYAQRIDVRKWRYVVRSGIKCRGLLAAVIDGTVRDTVVEIDEEFFESVENALMERTLLDAK
jgi:hypothetical protein